MFGYVYRGQGGRRGAVVETMIWYGAAAADAAVGSVQTKGLSSLYIFSLCTCTRYCIISVSYEYVRAYLLFSFYFLLYDIYFRLLPWYTYSLSVVRLLNCKSPSSLRFATTAAYCCTYILYTAGTYPVARYLVPGMIFVCSRVRSLRFSSIKILCVYEYRYRMCLLILHTHTGSCGSSFACISYGV